ncbi:CPK3, partial [Symbiodinium sp. CCMP2592]
ASFQLQLETNMIPRKLKKERRKAARQSMSRSLESHTILQQASVSPACLARYKRHWEEMEPMMLDGRGRLRPIARVDQALAEHLEDLYRDGEDLATARYAVAAALFFKPELRSPAMTHLPKVKQSRWVEQVVPSQESLAHTVCSGGPASACIELGCSGDRDLPAPDLFAVHATERGAPPPKEGRGEAQLTAGWVSTLVGGASSLGSRGVLKKQEFDECLQLDLPYHQPLGPATYKLLRLHQKRGEEHIFSVTLEDVTQFLERAQIELELKGLGELQPYRLRHGGASHDFVSKLRDLASIQMRGRWRSQSSVRRYQKGGRLTQLMQTLPVHVKKAAENAVRQLPAALAGLP